MRFPNLMFFQILPFKSFQSLFMFVRFSSFVPFFSFVLVITLVLGAGPASAKWIKTVKTVDEFTDTADASLLLVGLAGLKDEYLRLQCFQDEEFRGLIISLGVFLADSGTVDARMRFDKNPAFSEKLTVTKSGDAALVSPAQMQEYAFIDSLKKAKVFLVELTDEKGVAHKEKFRIGGFEKAYERVASHCAPILDNPVLDKPVLDK